MTAREYLEQPLKLKEEIQCDVDNLAAMRSAVEKVTTTLSFTAGCSPSKEPHAFESTMVNIRMEEEQIWEKTERLQNLIIEVLTKIRQLQNPKHQAVLRMRYIEGLTIRAIAARMELSIDRVKKIHADALVVFEDLRIASESNLL